MIGHSAPTPLQSPHGEDSDEEPPPLVDGRDEGDDAGTEQKSYDTDDYDSSDDEGGMDHFLEIMQEAIRQKISQRRSQGARSR